MSDDKKSNRDFMDQNRKAEIEFEVSELSQKLGSCLDDFMAGGKEFKDSRVLRIEHDRISEYHHRMTRLTDVLCNLLAHSVATIKINGGDIGKKNIKDMAAQIMDEVEEMYLEMAERRDQVIKEREQNARPEG